MAPVVLHDHGVNPVLCELLEKAPPMSRAYLRRALRLSEMKADALRSCSGGISRREADFLIDMLAELRPSRTLEVGLGAGVSCLAICEATAASATGPHVVIDPYQHGYWGGAGLRNLERAGCRDRIELHEDTSFRVLARLEAEGLAVDFAFVDGWHTFDYALVDLFYIDKMMRPGGVIAFDDADWPSIRKVVRFAVTNLPYRVHRCLPHAPGEQSRQRRFYERFLGLTGAVLGAASRIPILREPIRRVFDAEALGIDRRFGLTGSCIALRKHGADERAVDHFESF